MQELDNSMDFDENSAFGTHETFRSTTMGMILFWAPFMNSDYYSQYKKAILLFVERHNSR